MKKQKSASKNVVKAKLTTLQLQFTKGRGSEGYPDDIDIRGLQGKP